MFSLFFFPRLSQLASFAHTLQSTELASVGLPDFPIHNLVNIVRIMVSNVSLLLWHLISLNLKFWLIHYRYFLIKHLCVCCSSIFTFGTIFSEPVQNFLNWFNCVKTHTKKIWHLRSSLYLPSSLHLHSTFLTYYSLPALPTSKPLFFLSQCLHVPCEP